MLKVEQVRTLTTEMRHSYDLGDGTESGNCAPLSYKQMEDVIECLEWTTQQLEQRRVNSRKYLNKQKVVNRLLKEHLSEDELRSIDEQAREAAEEEK